jgi:hypothetical protein
MSLFISKHPSIAGWLYVAKIEVFIMSGFIAGAILASHLSFVWH